MLRFAVAFLVLSTSVLASNKFNFHDISKGAKHSYHVGTKPSHHIVPKPSTEIIQVPKCPEGFVPKKGHCVKPETVDKEEACPEGTFDDGTMCVLTTEGKVICEEGVYVGNLFCEVKSTTDGAMKCPEGSEPQGDKCFVGGMLTYCPAGTAQTEEGCETRVPKDFFCPPHQKLVGTLCVDMNFADTILICPEGTDLVHGVCIHHIVKEPVCPKGYTNEGETCAIFESPVRDQCPPEYHFNPEELTCTRVMEVPSRPECVEGGKLIDGMCKRIIPGPTTPVCGTGELIDGLCHVSSEFPAGYKCPHGYVLTETPKGPICTKVITFDCSIKTSKCADKPVPKHTTVHHKKSYGYSHHGKTQGGHHGKTQGGHHGKGYTAQPRYLSGSSYKHGHGYGHGHGHEKTVHEKKYGYCKKVDIIIPKTCEETLVAEAIPFCHEGEFNGKYCIVKDVFPPEEKCLGKITPSGECVIIESYRPVYICPEEFSPVGDGSMCEQVSIVAPTEQCPEGTVPFQGKCAIFADKECPKGGCEKTIKWSPQEICPEDFTLVVIDLAKPTPYGYKKHGKNFGKYPIHHTAYDKKCVNKNYFWPEAKCPAGFTPSSETTCHKFSEPIIVNEDKTVKPQFICPIGYAAVKGFICVQIGFQEAEVICPPSFTWILDTELCAKDVDPVDICPKGSKEIDGQCIIMVKTKEIYVEQPVLVVPMKTEMKKSHHMNYGKSQFKHHTKSSMLNYPWNMYPSKWSKLW